MSQTSEGSGRSNEANNGDLPSKFVVPGRSILKQKLGEEGGEENLTISDIPVFGSTQEIPSSLTQNNTTSRINTSKLQSKLKVERRVSFAPDVTLHRVDFVPQQSQSLREPRRKNAFKGSSNMAAEELADSLKAGEPWKSGGDISNAVSDGRAESALYTPVFDKEVSMEITQLFSKHSEKPEKSEETFDEAEDMEVTEFRGSGSTRPERDAEEDDSGEDLDLTKPQTSRAISIEGDVNMDITGPQRGIQHPETVSYSSRPVDDDQSDMETTEPFRTPITAPVTIADGEEAIANQLPISDELGSKLIVTSTQEIDDSNLSQEMHQDQNVSSKRRKLNTKNDEASFSAMAGTAMDDDMELTMMERLSPIQIPAIAGSRAHADDPVKLNNSEVESLSLGAFLDTVGIKAHRDIEKSTTVNKLGFGKVSENGHGVAVDVYRALYANMPILEIYAFCCKELLRRVQRSKLLFEELEQQIGTSASSSLFKKYLDSQGATRDKMNGRITLLREYSRLQAVKVWFGWRLGHLKGIKNVLQENLFTLREELDVLSTRITHVSDIKNRIFEIKQNIVREIRVCKESSKFKKNNCGSPTVPDRIKIESLKAELKDGLKDLEKISEMSKRAEALRIQVKTTKQKVIEAQKEIALLNSRIKTSSKFTKYEVPKLRVIFEMMQRLSGVLLRQYEGSVLKIELQGSPFVLNFDVTKSDKIDEIAISIADSATDLCKALCLTTIQSAQRSAGNGAQLIFALLAKSENVRRMLIEFESLNLVFPCKAVTASTGQVDIEIRFYDPILNDCATFLLSLDQFVLALDSDRSKRFLKLRLKSASQNGSDWKGLIFHFKSKASSFLPWQKAFEAIHAV
ncbi:kinetochore-microtubule binding complex subunit SPC105 LALA0_S13e02586g [Lachancea lanzarotensis]|uniref:LALA0S13e02586g1_1 n=1 Tax=Lachancea lanzarotensis TaxID=1245769 RepID=A0A0C7MXN5_9SACH|nr:uncharacterized protein LALA0_S13e02586g [Lachancea lanzarotensis]CEP64769.1 LALA0S13e02586g1_1 [Lachancea lanzarotensis]